MKQLAQSLRTGELSLDDVPPPPVQPGQLLVQTAYSLISAGTERTKIETGRKSLIGKALARPDQVRQVAQSVLELGVKATYEKVKTRLDARSPLGYSAAGIVLSVGTGVDGFVAGDRVACGGAAAAHAEIISVPRNLCVTVPAGVALDAAAFTTIGAIAMQGIRQADVRLGEHTVVIGLGLLGQLAVQLLKAAGCSVVGFDPDESRCRLASQLGADATASSEAALKTTVASLTRSRGADGVIITAGTSSNRPVEVAGEVCREKGRVVVVGAVGLTIPREPYYNKELDLRLSRSYGPGRYDQTYEEGGVDYPYGYVRWTEGRNMEAFLGAVAAGSVKLAPLITHRFGLEQATEAYALISGAAADDPYLGVLFEYPDGPASTASRIELGVARATTAGRLGIGVIGAGNFAQSMLLPQLKSSSHVAFRTVATLSPLRTRDVAERFGFTHAASGWEDVLRDPDTQAILIATRHDSHASLVMESLRAGKAVHVEKPLAMTPSELEQIVHAYHSASDRRPFVNVGFNRRFAPMVQAIVGFFKGRREPLAMNYRVNAGYIPLDHWTQDPQRGGGRVVGEVCHFIDLLQFIAGARVRHVYARALPDLGRYRGDNVAMTISMEDGSVGTILYAANGDKALPKEHLEVFGEGRAATLDDFSRVTLIQGGRTRTSREGARDKGHKGEMAAWVEAVRTGQAEPVPFDDAVTATQATFAVLTSVAEGRAVSLP